MRHRLKEIRSALPIVLFGIWPFASFLNHNQEDALIYAQRVIWYGVGFLTLLGFVWWTARSVLPHCSSRNIANTLAASVAVFFSYLFLEKLLSDLGITLGTVKIGIWFLAMVVVAAMVWRVSRFAVTTTFFNVMGGVLVFVPAVQLAFFAAHNVGDSSRVMDAGAQPDTASRAQSADEHSSNVYWFILDMYARADVLKTYLNYDNGEFVLNLIERDLFVADEAFSNYSGTSLSISATANMELYPTGVKIPPTAWDQALQGYNRVVTRFIERGYHYIQAEPGANRKTRCGGREDLCITAPPKGAFGITEAEVELLKLTPLYRIIRRLFPDLFSFDFTTLRDVMTMIDTPSYLPFFAFAHILSPHLPARYNPDCSKAEEFEWNLVAQGSKENVAGYLNDLHCVNREILAAVDEILSNDDSDPIIIIQGDHGIGLNFVNIDQSSRLSIEPHKVPHAILSAIRLPQRCHHLLSHKFSSVNTFRLVFACLGDENIEPLPNRLFAHGPEGIRPLDAD